MNEESKMVLRLGMKWKAIEIGIGKKTVLITK